MIRSGYALWLALLAAAWSTGFITSQARRASGLSRAVTTSVFVTGALLSWAWATLAGALLRADPSAANGRGGLAIQAGVLLRLATVASGVTPACLTAATVLAFVSIVMLGGGDTSAREPGLLERLGMISATVTLLLAVAVLYPAVAPPDTEIASVPLQLVHAGAATNALATLAALIMLAMAITWVVSVRVGVVPSDVGDEHVARIALGAWIVASVALFADQLARTAVTLPLHPGVTPPRNAWGVAIWLALGASTHPRVRGALLGRLVPRTSSAPRWAARLVHAGAAAIAIAFAAHIAAARTALTLAPGGAVQAADVFHRPWRLVNQGVSRFDAGATDVIALAVEVSAPSGRRGLLTPELREYHDVEGQAIAAPLSVRAVARGPLQDVLITLDSATTGDVATVRVAFVPLAVLWIPGILSLTLGGLVTLWHIPRPHSAA